MRILLVVYDNDSYVGWFPQGIAYIAAACRKAGHEVVVYSQDVRHHPEAHLTAFLDAGRYDAVCVGVIAGYYQYRKLLKIAEAVRAAKRPPFFILGGHGPSPEPEFFLRKTGADLVVVGEGEVTAVEVADALQEGKGFSGVRGVAYLEDGKLVRTAERPLIRDIDGIPFPAYDLFPMEHYVLLRMPHIENRERCIPILSGRGCTFTCNFCYRMDEGFRPRSAEGIVEEIRMLRADYDVGYIAFSDELLMSSERRTVELCEAFLRARLGVKWCCNGRLNYAKPDVLRLMKEAGCVFINYGIEAVDDRILRNMNKALTVKQIVAGIENTLASGISPGYNVIFGNIGESRETLRKGVEFLLRYDDHAQLRTIRPVTPYPGSPLYRHAVEKGLLGGVEDFYENRHVNSDLLSVNFTDLTDEEFHEALLEANRELIGSYYAHKCRETVAAAEDLYRNRNASFRGFRQ